MAVKSDHPNTMSSTGGPNTLVAPRLTPSVKEAIRFSAMIENSGQCTALRHAVVAAESDEEVESLFDGAPVVTTPQDSLRAGEFAGIFADSPIEPTPPGYTKVDGLNAHYKVSSDLPEDGVEEYWRKVFVDVTSPSEPLKSGSESANDLAAWLVRNQPISLAVNEDMELGRYLFERTGQVVYTVGTAENPALTCQARPQEGEVRLKQKLRGLACCRSPPLTHEHASLGRRYSGSSLSAPSSRNSPSSPLSYPPRPRRTTQATPKVCFSPRSSLPSSSRNPNPPTQRSSQLTSPTSAPTGASRISASASSTPR